MWMLLTLETQSRHKKFYGDKVIKMGESIFKLDIRAFSRNGTL